MTDESGSRADASGAEHQNHIEKLHWRESWPAFSTLVKNLIGTDQPAIVAKFFGLRRPQQVRDWRLGKAGIPTWVIETARQHVAKREANARAAIEKITPGPGYACDIQHKRKTPAP